MMMMNVRGFQQSARPPNHRQINQLHDAEKTLVISKKKEYMLYLLYRTYPNKWLGLATRLGN